MKNIFEKPELQIILVGSADIITTSGGSTETTFGEDVWTPWIEL